MQLTEGMERIRSGEEGDLLTNARKYNSFGVSISKMIVEKHGGTLK